MSDAGNIVHTDNIILNFDQAKNKDKKQTEKKDKKQTEKCSLNKKTIIIIVSSITLFLTLIVILVVKKIVLKKPDDKCIDNSCCELIEYCEGKGCCKGKDCCEERECELIAYCEGKECCKGNKCCECKSKEYCEGEGCCKDKYCCEECNNITKCEGKGCCNGKQCCKEENCKIIKQCNKDGCCNGNYCCIENTGIIIEIDQKINYVNIYDDNINKTLNIEINKVGKNRRLEEKTYYTEIKGKYLFSVYDFNKSDNSIIFYAYAVLLSLNKTNDQMHFSIGGDDIRYSNSNDFPFIKFIFDQNGLISNLQVEENYNSTLIAYIYEFINKIIPILDKNFYEEQSNNSPIKYSYENNNKEIFNIYKNEKETNSDIDGSTYIKNMTINIKDNEVKEVINIKDSSFKISNNFDSEIIHFIMRLKEIIWQLEIFLLKDILKNKNQL